MGERAPPNAAHREASRDRSAWIRLALVVLSAAAIVVLFRRVDWVSTESYLRQLGVRAPLALVPYLLALTSDAVGWQALFDSTTRLGTLWRIRVATEAVVASLPAGTAIGESVRVALLERQVGISITAGTANVIVTKLAIALSQGVFIVGGVALALSPVEAHSPVGLGRTGPGLIGLAVALVFLAVMVGALFFLSRGRVLTRGLGALSRAGGPRWRGRLSRLDEPVAQIDHGLAMLARVPRHQIVRALVLFLVGWLCLALENWLILSFLSVNVSFPVAWSIEAVVSVVRIGFFFLPGGLGAQEAGYYGLLKAYGVPHAEAAAAAFVIVKRAKELFWIAFGYLVLLGLPARGGSAPLEDIKRRGLGAGGGATGEPILSSDSRGEAPRDARTSVRDGEGRGPDRNGKGDDS